MVFLLHLFVVECGGIVSSGAAFTKVSSSFFVVSGCGSGNLPAAYLGMTPASPEKQTFMGPDVHMRRPNEGKGRAL